MDRTPRRPCRTDDPLATSEALLGIREKLAAEILATSEALLDVHAMLTAGYVRRLRERAGISQQALGEILGCTQAIVSEWETGTKKPGAELGLRLHAVMRKFEEQLIADGQMGYAIGYTPVPAVVSV